MLNKNIQTVLDRKLLARTVLLVGKQLIESGAEMNRAEDTMVRIINNTAISNDCDIQFDLQVTMHAIFIKIENKYVDFVSIRERHFNIAQVIKINQLSRDYANNIISLENLFKKSEKTIKPNKENIFLLLAMSILSASIAAILTGSLLYISVSFFLGSLSYVVQCIYANKINNTFLFNLIVSFIGGLFIIITCRLFQLNSEIMNICFVVSMVPGIRLTLGFQDIISNYPISGFVTTIESMFNLVALSLGVSTPSLLIGNINYSIVINIVSVPLIIQILGGFCSAVSFAYIIFIPKKYYISVGLVGILTWVTFVMIVYLTNNYFTANILSAIALNVLSLYFARIKRTPFTVFGVPALVSIVPGITVIKAANELITGQATMAMHSLSITGISLIGIFIGSLLGNYIFKFFFPSK